MYEAAKGKKPRKITNADKVAMFDWHQEKLEEEAKLKENFNRLKNLCQNPCVDCAFYFGYISKNYGCEPTHEAKCLLVVADKLEIDEINGNLKAKQYSSAYSSAIDIRSVRDIKCNGNYFIKKQKFD